ncbi:MAG TPA: hypothetical protein VLD85_15080 [Anaeromyxobacteraceae bacterium]|nr:hypothetical protein [Anaeromyxobacteraceae bacterium]
MPAAQALPRQEWLASGVGGGLFAGAVMALFLMLATGAGTPWGQPFRAIGATFIGAGALEGGAGAIAFGAILHALTSAVLGLGFVALFPRDFPRASGAVVGLGYALFAMAIMTSLVVPAVNPAFASAVQPTGGTWVVAHALFGAVLGLYRARGRRA